MQLISAHELIDKLLQTTSNAVTIVDVRDEVMRLPYYSASVLNSAAKICANGRNMDGRITPGGTLEEASMSLQRHLI